jgi:hypothetical protein
MISGNDAQGRKPMPENAKARSRPFDYAAAEKGLRGPRHRWDLAMRLPLNHWDRRMEQYDQRVRAAHRFLELVAHSPVGAKQAAAMFPHIAAAVAIEQDPTKVADLKIAVFGDLAPHDIARRTGVDAAALETWEALFYDARQSREHFAWVREHIVDAELAAGNVDLATKLQLVAALGPLGATTILDIGSRAPASEGERLFRRKLALHLKYDRAMAMTEGPKHHVAFLRYFSQLKLEESRLKLQEKRLAEKCNAALRRHEIAKIRAEQSLERAKARAAGEARKAEEAALRGEGEQYARELQAAHMRELELAEQREAEARAAASPLTRLRWGAGDAPSATPRASSVPTQAEAGAPPERPVSLPFSTLVRPRAAETLAAQTA